MPIFIMTQTQEVGGCLREIFAKKMGTKTRRYAKTLSIELQLVILIAMSLGNTFCVKILM